MTFEVVVDDRRPAVWRTVLLVLPTAFLGLASVVFSPLGWAMQHSSEGYLALAAAGCMVLAMVLPLSLFWRHRFPFLLTLGAAVLPLVIPIGNALAFTLLAGLIGRRRGHAVWATIAAVAATSTWVVVADAVAQPQAASFAKMLLGPTGAANDQPMDLPLSAVVVTAVILFGLTVGAGFLMRWRRLAQDASLVAVVERAASGRLGDEVARRQERERIAREVHDAMGHRLSLLNLHAGALELNAGDDPRLQESAGLVRKSAGEAMDDLRGLLHVLREPLDEQAVLPLTKLPEVVRDSFGAGQVVSSSVFISEAERADPALSRAVYRIVQELLTNARKHAPGEPVLLNVEGGPASGVLIEARNPYRVRAGDAKDSGSTRGLTGMAERAELLGGQLQYGLDEGGTVFRVRVELPWREAGAP